MVLGRCRPSIYFFPYLDIFIIITFPSGLFGVLRIIAFVFGLKAASSSLGSIFQPLAERQLSFDYEFKDDLCHYYQ